MKNLSVIILIFLISIGLCVWALNYDLNDNSSIESEETKIQSEQNVPNEDLSRYFDNTEESKETVLEIKEEDKCVLFGEVSTSGTVSSNTVCLSSEN